jgi:hypothetical protein
MAATKYRPIRDAQRNGTVPKTVIRDAVRKLAELRRTDPTKYKAKIKSGSGKHVYLVVKHT